MSAPDALKAFEAYATDPGNMAYLASPEFEARSNMLFERIAAGEMIPAGAAADALGLPWPVFRYLFGSFLASQATLARLGAEAARATKH